MSQGHSAVEQAIRENEPLLTELQKEQRQKIVHRLRTQSAEDEALGIVRKTPFGPKLRVHWSLAEAMKEA